MYPVCWCSLLQCWGGGEGALRQRGMRRGPCSREAPEGREEAYVRSLYIYTYACKHTCNTTIKTEEYVIAHAHHRHQHCEDLLFCLELN